MDNLLLVGGYTPPMGSGRGIYLIELTGHRLIDRGLVAVTESPSFLIAHEDVVYVVNEAEQGRVTSFRWAGEQLRQVSVQNTGGAHPCHLAVHPSGRLLAATNYTSGSVSLHQLDGAGGIAPRTDVIQLHGRGPVADRQEGPHAHQVVFAGDLMFVVDLGSDRVWRYRLDLESLSTTALDPLVLPPGFGPRQLVVEGGYGYVLGELSSNLAGYDLAAAESPLFVVPAYGEPVPADNLAATLLAPEPGRLAVSHRGADRVSLFDVSPDSAVLTGEFSSGGAGPRHLVAVAEDYLMANEVDDRVVLRSPDGTERQVSVPNPTCILPAS